MPEFHTYSEVSMYINQTAYYTAIKMCEVDLQMST